MAKHTLGPWQCTETHPDNGTIWIDTTLDHIGEVYGACKDLDISEEQAKANAQLIAAAPDMLQALQEAREDIAFLRDGDDGLPELLAHYDAVIAKATGGI